MSTSYDVYGVGNSLVDIQARIDDSALELLQFQKGIMTLVDEATQTRVLDSIRGAKINRCAGGSAANTIAGLVDFGGQGAYAGKTGSDELGEFWLKDMRNLGVTIEVPQVSGQTGACVVLITEDAQRTMLTHLGLSATLSPNDISEAEIRKSKIVYIEGYLFAGETTTAAAMKAPPSSRLGTSTMPLAVRFRLIGSARVGWRFRGRGPDRPVLRQPAQRRGRCCLPAG